MRGNAPHSPHTGVPGWIADAEENLFIMLASGLQDGSKIVQLGGEFGRSAAAFAHALKARGRENVRVVSVDRFPNDYQDVGSLEATFKANLNEAGLFDYVDLIKSDTVAAGNAYEGQDIDLLFVDAGHHYAEIAGDIAAWFPHVKTDGLIVFHDYGKRPDAHYLHFDVKRAVDEWHAANPDWQRYDGAESVVYFTGPDAVVAFGSTEEESEFDDPDLDDDDTTLTVNPLATPPANLPIKPDDQTGEDDDIDWELLASDYDALDAPTKRLWTRERKKAEAAGKWPPETPDDETFDED